MKILVAIDGSTYTQKALDYLAANPSIFIEGNELVCLHVANALPSNVRRHIAKDAIDDYFAEETAKVVDPVKAFLAGRGVGACTFEQRQGSAPDEIGAAANEIGADLIVMGTRGHGALGRALVGSVATKVISESDIAVLLVK